MTSPSISQMSICRTEACLPTSRRVPPSPPPMTSTLSGFGWGEQRYVSDHFVISGLVKIAGLNGPVQDQHPPQAAGLDYLDPLIGGLPVQQDPVHFDVDSECFSQFGIVQEDSALFRYKIRPDHVSYPRGPTAVLNEMFRPNWFSGRLKVVCLTAG